MTSPIPNQMNFTVGNPNQPGVIYLSSDPTQNTLSLKLSCNVDVTLQNAQLVSIDQAGNGSGSLFYLDMRHLQLDSATFMKFQLVAEGWNYEAFSDSANGNMLALTPSSTLTLQANQELTFDIQQFVLPSEPGSNHCTLYLLTFGVAGVADADTQPLMSGTPVTFVTPPQKRKGNLADVLTLSVSPADGVGVSLHPYPIIENHLKFTLTQKPNEPVPLGNASTTFSLTATYSDDPQQYGALMSGNESKKIDIPSFGSFDGWTTTSSDDTTGRSWLLQPPSGQPLVDGSVAFIFGPLETFAKGGPSMMLLTYSNVHGYNDGAFAIVIQKQPHVSIDSFQVTPLQSALSGANVNITASWATSNATSLMLHVGDAKPIDVTDNVPPISAPIPITETTNVWLEATGYGPGGVDNNASSQTIPAVVQPQLVSFSASPAAIYAGDMSTPYPVTISWNVNGAAHAYVALGGGAQEQFPAIGVRNDNLCISGPLTYTLTAQCSDAGPLITANLTIPASIASMRVVATDLGAVSLTAVPNVPFVAMNQNIIVSIVSTATGNTVATESVENYMSPDWQERPEIGQIVFSPDGTIMLIGQCNFFTDPMPASNAMSQIEVYSVTASTGPESFTVTHLQSLQFEQQTICAITFSTVGSFFVALNGINDQSQLMAFAKGANLTYVGQSLTDFLPRCSSLALSQDGKYLFVSDGGHIVSINLADQYPTTMDQNFGGSLLVSPDGGTLIAFNGNRISLYDLSPSKKPRRDLSANAPTALGIILNGEYAVFASADCANLINIALGSISPPIPISQGSTAMCIASDGTMVFGSEKNSGLTLLSFPPLNSGSNTQVGLNIQKSGIYITVGTGTGMLLLEPVTTDRLLTAFNIMLSVGDGERTLGTPVAIVFDRTVDANGVTNFTVHQTSPVLNFNPLSYDLQTLALETPLAVQAGQIVGFVNTGPNTMYLNWIDPVDGQGSHVLRPYITDQIGYSLSIGAGDPGTPVVACGWNFTSYLNWTPESQFLDTIAFASKNPSVFGTSVTFTAMVTGSAGTPGGTVTFFDDTTSIGSAPLDASGVASINTSTLLVGTHTITVNYSGDANYHSNSAIVSQFVNRAASAIALAPSNNPSVFGTSVDFKATVTGSAGTPGGTVTFFDGTTSIGSAPLDASGVASISTSTLMLGTHNINASYSGDANYNASAGAAVSQLVSRAASAIALAPSNNPSVFGTSVTFTATATGSAGTPGGTVRFFDGTTDIGSAPLDASGVALIKFSPLSPGMYYIQVNYSGDANYCPSISASAGVIQSVDRATSAIALASSNNSSALGTSVTFTAVVTGSVGTPGGTVTFFDDTTSVGSAPLDAAGVASINTSTLLIGTHTITVNYSGDANYHSNSAIVSQVVHQTASATALASNYNTSRSGTAVTFTATVTGSDGTPGGTVTFFDDTTLIDSVPLDALGVASISTSTLMLGTHNIYASYSGDANYCASISNAVSQLVITPDPFPLV